MVIGNNIEVLMLIADRMTDFIESNSFNMLLVDC